MNADVNLFLGTVSTMMLAIVGYFLKRVITEIDKILTGHQNKLIHLADKIGDLTREQAIMNERMIRLIKVDEKYHEIEHKVMALQEHEAFSRKRFHELGNYVNGLVGSLIQHGIKIDDIFNGENWKF